MTATDTAALAAILATAPHETGCPKAGPRLSGHGPSIERDCTCRVAVARRELDAALSRADRYEAALRDIVAMEPYTPPSQWSGPALTDAITRARAALAGDTP